MYLTYLDDSGSPHDPNSDFFVLGGMMLFERQTHWLDSKIAPIAERFQSDGKHRELHAGPMRTGKEGWDQFSPDVRIQATADLLRLLDNRQLKVQVFATVVEKRLLKASDIVPYCFETMAASVDDWLAYQYRKYRRPERGIFILDRSKEQIEQAMQALHHAFKHAGHAKGKLRNFAEVPLFLDSKASRLIQMADHIAYWIYRRYQACDDRGFQIIQPHFCKLGREAVALHEVLSCETRERLKYVPTPKYPFPSARLPAETPAGHFDADRQYGEEIRELVRPPSSHAKCGRVPRTGLNPSPPSDAHRASRTPTHYPASPARS